MEKTIGICIPTYNRSNFLEKSLALSIKNIEGDCPPIFISDNNSFDNTAETVKLAKQIYPNIIYENNSENLGSEKNFEKVLKMSKTPYSWLMGDDEHVGTGFSNLKRFVNKHVADAYIITEGKAFREGVYNSSQIFLDIIGYTLGISALILSKDIIESGNFGRYAGTEFVHSGVFLDYIIKNPKSKIGVCHNKDYITQTDKGFCEWEHRKLEVMLVSFPSMVERLPLENAYQIKRHVFKKMFSKRGGVSLMALLSLRQKNFLNHEIVQKHKNTLSEHGNRYYYYLMLISIIPIRILALPRFVYKAISDG